MENDTTTMTPVQQSNASAALPGAGGASAGSPAGGSAAASGLQDSASTAAPAPVAAPTSQPYATMTTPTAVNVPTPRPRPFAGPNPRLREDVVTAPAFGARGASEVQWTAQSRLTQEQENAIRTEAGRLGIAPSTLAAVMAYETIGTFNTDIQGGTGGNYRGLIQFGPTERATYGYRDGMTFEEQLAGPVHNYLVDRGVRPGHGIAEVYSIINAGSLRNGAPRWNASDRPGYTVRRHVEEITSTRLPEFTYLDEGWTPPRQEVDIPSPRLRGDVTSSPAFGAAGARSMPDGQQAAVEPILGLPTLAGTVNGEGRIVERGARGEAVRELQTFLNDRGYTDAAGRPLRVDGDYGRRTKEAVKAFQSASQIEVDGRVGPETLSAALYSIDPTSSPMPGQVAYTSGANAAQRIIDPGAPEVAIPLPRPRPERGEGIPNPRMRPGAADAGGDLTPEQIDFLTMTDENGNYINQPPADTQPPAPEGNPPPAKKPYEPTASPLRQDENGNVYYGPADVGRSVSEYRSYLIMSGIKGESLDEMVTRLEHGLMRRGGFRYASGQTAAEIGAMTSDYRDVLIGQGETGERLDTRVNNYERTLKRIVGDAQRTSDASDAARGATRQRLSGMAPRTDRFRPRDSRSGGEVERIRTTEAVREYARGIADVYRRVADRRRTAVAASGDPDQQRFVTDALMRAAPTPAETVTKTYAFRRRRVA